MASEIGIVKTLVGTATATASDGSQRSLQAGDKVFQDEVITTGAAGAVEVEFSDGSLMTLGRSSQTLLDIDAFDPQAVAQAPTAAVDSEVDALQQALLEGADPSQIGEATAAGAGAGAGGNEGTDFVQVLYEAPEVTPESGFDTTGITVEFDEEREEVPFDDTPTAGITTVLLDEDDLISAEELSADFDALRTAFEAATGFSAFRANAQGVGDQADGDDIPPGALTVLSGTLATDFGADGAGDIAFNAATPPAGLTSGGEDVQYFVSEDGHSLIAYTLSEETAEIIFTAEITDVLTGAFTVALYGPVDHADGATEDNITLDFGFTISDLDGDTAQGTLRFDIDDDVPVTGETVARVDEDDLGGGQGNDSSPQLVGVEGSLDFDEFFDNFDIPGEAPWNYYQGNDDEVAGDDVARQPRAISEGTLNVNFGADGPGSIVFNQDEQTQSLTSQGDDIQYWVSADGQSLVAYSVRDFDYEGNGGPFDDGGPLRLQEIPLDDNGPSQIPQYVEVVFTAEITDSSTGQYLVTLYSPVDHPDTTTEDNVQIDLGYTITDFDGDSAQGTLTVDVDDDSPIIINLGEDYGTDYGDEGYVTSGLQIIHDESAGEGYQVGKGDTDFNDDIFTIIFPDGDAPVDLIGLSARPVEYEGVQWDTGIGYDAGADGLKNLALTDADGALLTGQDSGLKTSDTGASIYLYTIPTELIEGLGGELPPYLANMADNFVVGLTVPGLDLTDLDSLEGQFESLEDLLGNIAFVVGVIEDIGSSYPGAPDSFSDSFDDVMALLQLKAIQHPDTDDHDDLVSIEDLIHITITDNDGDSATQAITVSFDDDGPKIGNIRTGRVDEEGLQPEGNRGDSYDDGGDANGARTTVSKSLKINWGADNDNVDGDDAGGDRSVAFVEREAPVGLTSNGVQVEYSYTNDGTLLTATAGSAFVFTVTLSDLENGSYDFVLLDNLDHPEGATLEDDEPDFQLRDERPPQESDEPSPGTEDNIVLGFRFTATDSDGDTASRRFKVSVDDDAPVIGVGEDAPERSVVDEEGLATAATQDDGYDGDVAGFALKANGDLNISWGSDDNNDGGAADRSVTFDAYQYGVSGLTSNGVDVEYSVSPDGTVLTATAGGTPVFTVTLSDLESGSYDFELHDNLDHSRSKTGGIDTEDNLNIKFSFTATDSDGDTVSDAFTVSVDDDGPVIGEALSENDDNSILLGARDGSAGLDDWGVTPGALTGAVTMNGVTANISFQDNDSNPSSMLRIYNNDDDHIGGGSIGDNDNEGINAGETLTISFDKLMQQAEIGVDGLGNHFLPGASQQAHATWVAYKNGVQVGSGEIDNPEGQNEGPAGLLEVFTVSIPGGFDSIVLGNNSNNDGSNYEVRYLQAQTLNIVDEEGMPEGNLGDSYSDNGDVAGAALTTSADLNIIWGADDNNRGTADRSITFDYQLPPDGFMSNGVQVVYNYNVGEDLLTATAGHGGPTVFTVTLSDLESGSFEFRLLDNLDHDHRSGANTEDDINLTFAFTATDSDGDTVNGSFTVTVDDDGPVVTPYDTNTMRIISDDDTVAGLNGNPGDTSDNDEANQTGTLQFSAGADGGTVAWNVGNSTTDDATAGVTFSVDAITGSLILTQIQGVEAVQIAVVTLNEDTGAYDYTQTANVLHTPGNAENEASFTLGFTVTDGDGDTADGKLTLLIDDDTPVVIGSNTIRFDEGDLLASRGEGESDGEEPDGLSDGEEPDGVGDSDESNHTGTLQFSAGADGGTVAWNVDNSTTDDATAGVTFSVDAITGSLILTQIQGVEAVQIATVTLDKNTGDYSYTQTANVLHTPGNDENEAAFTLGFTVTDGDGDTADGKLTLLIDDDTPATPADINKTVQEGNLEVDGYLVTEGVLPGDFGADGPAALQIVSFTHNNVTYNTASAEYDAVTKNLTIDTAADGTMAVNFESGTYAYTGPANVDVDTPEAFVFTVEDGDGDQQNGNLTIVVEDSVPVAVDNANQAMVQVVHETVPGIETTTILADFTTGYNRVDNPWIFDDEDNSTVDGDERTVKYYTTSPAENAPDNMWGVESDITVSDSGYVSDNVHRSNEGTLVVDADYGKTAVATPAFTITSGDMGQLTFELSFGSIDGNDEAEWQLLEKVGSTWTTVERSGPITIYGVDDKETVTINNIDSGTYRLHFRVEEDGDGDAQFKLDNITLTTTAPPITLITTVVTSVIGNVLTDANTHIPSNDPWGAVDSEGADGAALMVWDGSAFIDPTASGSTIVGLYGSLTINSDGSYEYTPTADINNLGEQDVFTYQLAQTDGDTDDAQLVITIGGTPYVEPTPIVGNDVTGTSDDDVILGTADGDMLDGGDGNDHIEGGDGRDTIIGGKGDDVLFGGDDADTFVWNSADVGTPSAIAHDVVVDFDATEGDVLNLSDLLSGGSYTIEGIDNGSGDLQLNISQTTGGGYVVQEIELNGVATGGDAAAALNALLISGAIDDGT